MRFKLLLARIRPGRRFILSFSLVLVLIVGGLFFVFLRHRQLCSFQQAVNAGLLSAPESQANLCPSLASPSSWGQVITNAFNLGIANDLRTGTLSLFQLQAAGLENCTDQLNPLCWLGDGKPILKQSDGFTNVLIVGLDTRERSRLMNTDSIMLVSLDHASGKLMLMSFPRDLYITYRNPSNARVAYKINGVYALNGLAGLNSVINQITGKPIHYYAYINLGVFSEAITALGGIDVMLDKPFSDLFPCVELEELRQGCKGRRTGFGRFEFPAGLNHFDAIDANVYARSRYASSDFDRARRQQHILSSLLKAALHSEKPLTERLTSYIDLYNIFKEEVISNVQLEDVAGLFAIADQLNESPLQVTLDPALDKGRIVKNSGVIPGAGYSIEFRDPTFKQFQNFISSIWSNLAFYSERPKILIVNASGEEIDPNSAAGKVINSHPEYTEIKYTSSKEYDLEGMRIYSFTEKSASLNQLVTLIPGSLAFSAELDGIKRSDYQEDLLLIIGKQSLVDENFIQQASTKP